MLKRSGLVKKTKGLIKQALEKTQLFLTFCINHTLLSPATKIIKANVCSATDPTAFPRKLKIAATTLPTTASNASTAFPATVMARTIV